MHRPRDFCTLMVFPLLAACESDGAALGSATNTDTESSSPTTGAPTITADPTRDTGDSAELTEGVDSSTSGPTDPTSTSGQTEETGTDTGEPLVPDSCLALLEAEPGTPSGVYTLAIDGNPLMGIFEAYCDMELAGGGWTLAGRSVPKTVVADTPFGFFSSTGAVTDDSLAYSLDVGAARIDFTQILVGTYTEGKTWGANAYIIDVPESFLWFYRNAPYYADPATPVLGDCMPEAGPDFLRWVGWTEQERIFYFSETSYDVTDGLRPDLLDTDYDDCDNGANLHQLSGMLFVR